MQHDDRRRPVRRRPIGQSFEALAVGDDGAKRALDPGKTRHRARAGAPAALALCPASRSAPRGWAAQLVLRSASTCLLIALPLLWYISDETKLHFGRECSDAS